MKKVKQALLFFYESGLNQFFLFIDLLALMACVVLDLFSNYRLINHSIRSLFISGLSPQNHYRWSVHIRLALLVLVIIGILLFVVAVISHILRKRGGLIYMRGSFSLGFIACLTGLFYHFATGFVYDNLKIHNKFYSCLQTANPLKAVSSHADCLILSQSSSPMALFEMNGQYYSHHLMTILTLAVVTILLSILATVVFVEHKKGNVYRFFKYIQVDSNDQA